ncbi:flippase-like domain-containing protein [Hymenobacter latericus]|uniref:flippase-like domain-containing protein n=1 Tax=Hymenobacter sp. YIM 151858-1 TaxID=2987688 RepID=UPI0022271239|nr:flippase-like domain-containing protein [Hymenobacter sp. YIM 151858-1]UYZ60720.1 flippase-like domain-containing protein [Hymenobacter sp. YIM 151858-1]
MVLGKLAVTGLTLWLLWQSVVADAATAAAWRGLITDAKRGPAVLALLLVPLNWALEAWKWWRLARHLEPVSFARSFRAVLVGLTLGFVTPNRVGDYAGRLLELKNRRPEALGAVFLGRYCQLIITLLAGAAGGLYFVARAIGHTYPAVVGGLVLTAVLGAGLLLLPLYRSRYLLEAVLQWRPLGRFRRYVANLPHYPARVLHEVLLVSGLRYAVFTAQFGLLLWAYGAQAPLGAALAAIAGTFLLKSLVPSLNALTDVGARELSATHLFGLLGLPVLPVLSASLSLWVLNIALPSAAGLLFVLRLKVLRRNRKHRKQLRVV